MIPQTARKEYLDRELCDLHKYKSLTDVEIDKRLSALNPIFHTTPYHHQKICFIAGTDIHRLLFFLWMGTGKTKIILDLLVQHWSTGVISKRVLVLVPNEVNVEAWKDEGKIHQPSLFIRPLSLKKSIPGDAHIVVSSYQRLTRLMTNSVKSTKRKKGKMEWIVDKERLERFSDFFDAIICDESTALMNPNSLTTKIILAISWRCKVSYGLTGTPFGRDLQALFPQFLAIDKGAAFGRGLGLFREVFFTKHRDYWKRTIWKFRENTEHLLRRAMRNSSIHYDLGECINLPAVVENTIAVTLSSEASEIYSNMTKVSFSEGAERLRNNFIRMRQIATGFVVIQDDDGRIEMPFDQNPKLDALRELIDATPADCKVVIFNEFIRSGAAIVETLTAAGYKSARLYSGTKDKSAELRKFLDDESCKAFVCNSQSGAFGLNNQIANYVIFYESPVSPIVREQAKARCQRTGQTRTVFCYDIIARGTIEEKILSRVREGKDLLSAILRGEEFL